MTDFTTDDLRAYANFFEGGDIERPLRWAADHIDQLEAELDRERDDLRAMDAIADSHGAEVERLRAAIRGLAAGDWDD